MIYNLYVYNRRGKCLYYREWYRPLNTLSDDPDEERKLMFGMVFALKELTSQMSSVPGEFRTMKTNSFTLHHFQSASGIMFVVNSDQDTGDLSESLQHIYSNIFVGCVTRNPLYKYVPDEPIQSVLFERRLEEYVKSVLNR